MAPFRLLAKSARGGAKAQTIRYHTAQVLAVARALAGGQGRASLAALGLDPGVFTSRLERDLPLAAFLHDLGKAGSHFVRTILGDRETPQGIRHEAVSFLIAGLPAVRDWLRPVVPDDAEYRSILWAVAGHHRKFPPESARPGAGHGLTVYLSHGDFTSVLDLGRSEFGLGPVPALPDVEYSLGRLGVFAGFDRERVSAERAMRAMGPDGKKYVALLKLMLICSDVAGSIGYAGGEPIAGWVGRSLATSPTASDLQAVADRRLGGRGTRAFQEEIADSTARCTFVKAGCGSGKTVAAYLWAARRHPLRKLFFCYPTTGTTTAGFLDHLDGVEGSDLIHGRAGVDREIFEIGDDDDAAGDAVEAFRAWDKMVINCTTDVVLGLLQLARRGVYYWPAIANGAFVFDEIHAYDDRLFAALLRFVAELPGLPVLLMTASLPAPRLEQLRSAAGARGDDFKTVSGPHGLENLPTYRIRTAGGPEAVWGRVRDVLAGGGKVLWVCNTVGSILRLRRDGRAAGCLLYHSRYRYRDRVARHREVLDAFDARGPVLAITSQVCEMSLDISADLLVSELAPIPAVIQRLGRLNRRAQEDGSTGTMEAILYEAGTPLPYDDAGLALSRGWVAALGAGDLSQADLVRCWPGGAAAEQVAYDHSLFDGGYYTEPRHLREAGHGLDIILPEDAVQVSRGRVRAEEVVVPMGPPPQAFRTHDWPEVRYRKVPPGDLVEYHPLTGGRWRDGRGKEDA